MAAKPLKNHTICQLDSFGPFENSTVAKLYIFLAVKTDTSENVETATASDTTTSGTVQTRTQTSSIELKHDAFLGNIRLLANESSVQVSQKLH